MLYFIKNSNHYGCPECGEKFEYFVTGETKKGDCAHIPMVVWLRRGVYSDLELIPVPTDFTGPVYIVNA